MVRKVDLDELVGLDEVAVIFGLGSAKAASVYSKRHEDFPEPALRKGRCVLWLRADVVVWAAARRTK